jgi:MurNAc alpha-1-phosphate uridylyltransferase
MKAMILAAGRGERLRPLTDETPKPLIKVAGKSLIEYHLLNLANAGFTDIVINTAWLANKIHETLGDGNRYGVSIQYSDEGVAQETAGGIINALSLLGNEPFLVVNGDICCDFDFSNLPDLKDKTQAHLVLVNNPEHNPAGDFAIAEGMLCNQGKPKYTYSGIGIYSPRFFSNSTQGVLPLAPMLKKKAEKKLITAQRFTGLWTDVGSIERLHALEDVLSKKHPPSKQAI